MTDITACLSSEKMDWKTPPDVLKPVRHFFAGEIDLDPCSSGDDLVHAKYSYTEASDGLWQSWSNVELLDKGQAPVKTLFVNPPYGRMGRKWIEKCAITSLLGELEILALVPARPDTRWFQDHVFGAATSICWWTGRVKFLGATSGAPFPSVIVYYGDRPRRFERTFKEKGVVTHL